MKLVETSACARAALLGNPSDGYGGKTISFAFDDFSARVVTYEWPEFEIVPATEDQVRFGGLDELVSHVRANGYYGGLRVVSAAAVRFAEWCRERSIDLGGANVAIRYETDIPRGVGLGGSSAIATAVVEGLCRFYGVEVPIERLPTLVLEAETEELGIAAGLQDRVAQAYRGLTYMDFDPGIVSERGHGAYEPLDPMLLPPLRIAYLASAAQPSEQAHAAVRDRFRSGDTQVSEAMLEIAALAERGRAALLAGDHAALGELMDRNLDLRASVFELEEPHLAMVEAVRALGLHCNYAGSGGAIVILAGDEDSSRLLGEALGELGCELIEPRVASAHPGADRSTGRPNSSRGPGAGATLRQ